jgi:hypothetical protein
VFGSSFKAILLALGDIESFFSWKFIEAQYILRFLLKTHLALIARVLSGKFIMIIYGSKMLTIATAKCCLGQCHVSGDKKEIESAAGKMGQDINK